MRGERERERDWDLLLRRRDRDRLLLFLRRLVERERLRLLLRRSGLELGERFRRDLRGLGDRDRERDTDSVRLFRRFFFRPPRSFSFSLRGATTAAALVSD